MRAYASIYANVCAYTRICSHIRVYARRYAYMHTYPFGQSPETEASLQRRSLGHRPARATPMIFDLGHLTAPSCTHLEQPHSATVHCIKSACGIFHKYHPGTECRPNACPHKNICHTGCTHIRLANLLKQQRRCSVSAWDTVLLERRR